MGGPERHPKIKAVALLARLEHTKRGSEGLQSITEAGSHRGSSPKGWDHLLLLRSTTTQACREGTVFLQPPTSSRLLGGLHFPLTFNTEVKKTEQPMSTKISKPVTLCSRIPRNLGCSPGAEQSDSTLRLFTWVMDRTVAATNQGSPITEHTPSITATMKRSRWYPHPFCRQENKKQSIP